MGSPGHWIDRYFRLRPKAQNHQTAPLIEVAITNTPAVEQKFLFRRDKLNISINFKSSK